MVFQVHFMKILMKKDIQFIIPMEQIEDLTSDQFVLSDDGQTVTINGLKASESNVVVSSTLKKQF